LIALWLFAAGPGVFEHGDGLGHGQDVLMQRRQFQSPQFTDICILTRSLFFTNY
jgi:hypothetical protein